MKNTREAVRACFQAMFFVLSLLVCVAQAQAQDDRWPQLRKAYFGDTLVTLGDDVITMDAPGRAHDAATVPITITVVDTERQVRKLYLFVDQNPLPLAGIFKFTEEAGLWHALETRIRINEYTHVRAVGVLANGELHMSERFVKAAGGCSAPAMADMDKAMARAGKMKLLLDEVNASDTLPFSEAVIKISHPNNSGMQFDQISRNYIPAFYVNHIKADIDGVEVLDVETNFSMSENPVIRLAFNGEMKATTLNVVAMDSKGNQYEKSASLTTRNTN
ncbi:quinoprotein dehydrogenase-associated SoxYZ-like carrier [Granulosicoccus antarcticus]|uniref:Ig-like SoxY domain-containing protein n=1 Tax=Granulosicoccus antarcticus IMCC3135 TaxID=1192854 RepID=A0A2Z2NG28_9GAMM|nr:quinoprotein dehydrogenase-associated SoxYZ-like carrier [Granulosicoccus antarcticus]ASJ70216.1 hypothetical protein IMCC3135_00450 [Granulosicoccus antarcticus IMCC3135]